MAISSNRQQLETVGPGIEGTRWVALIAKPYLDPLTLRWRRRQPVPVTAIAMDVRQSMQQKCIAWVGGILVAMSLTVTSFCYVGSERL